jgi:Tfp pilus assembly protein PilW
MRQRGNTIVELMIAAVALGSLFATLASTGAWMHRADHTAAAYAKDVDQCRRALSQLERDLRQARHVDHDGSGLRVQLPDATIDYQLHDGVLSRTTADTTTVVARCIGSLAAEQAGRLVTVRLTLQPRAANPGRQAAIDTVIYLRNGGE